MILTDKAKKDFELYLSQNYGKFETTTFQECASAPQYPIFLDEINLPESIENALIIEFFDDKDIFINIDKWSLSFWRASINNPYLNSLGCNFSSRQEATTEAIKKANEIYNER